MESALSLPWIFDMAVSGERIIDVRYGHNARGRAISLPFKPSGTRCRLFFHGVDVLHQEPASNFVSG